MQDDDERESADDKRKSKMENNPTAMRSMDLNENTILPFYEWHRILRTSDIRGREVVDLGPRHGAVHMAIGWKGSTLVWLGKKSEWL